jgi:hypothetical protein
MLMPLKCERIGNTEMSIESSDLVDAISVIAKSLELWHATKS